MLWRANAQLLSFADRQADENRFLDLYRAIWCARLSGGRALCSDHELPPSGVAVSTDDTLGFRTDTVP